MFFICRKSIKNGIPYYGVIDTTDGVIDDFTVQELLKIIRGTKLSIDGVVCGDNGKVTINVLKPKQYDILSSDDYVDSHNVKSVMMDKNPLIIRDMFKGIPHEDSWGNYIDASLKIVKLDLQNNYIDFGFAYSYNTYAIVCKKDIVNHFNSLTNVPAGLSLLDIPSKVRVRDDFGIVRLRLTDDILITILRESLLLLLNNGKLQSYGNACFKDVNVATNTTRTSCDLYYNLGTMIIPVVLSIKNNLNDMTFDYEARKLWRKVRTSPKLFASISEFIKVNYYMYNPSNTNELYNCFNYKLIGDNIMRLSLKKGLDSRGIPLSSFCGKYCVGFEIVRDNEFTITQFTVFFDDGSNCVYNDLKRLNENTISFIRTILYCVYTCTFEPFFIWR